MRAALLSVSLLALTSSPVYADGDSHLDGRIRYETADFDGNANTAEALTWRNRYGVQFSLMQGWSFLAEGEHVFHLIDDFNDTTNGQTQFPVIADPETHELNRLQLAYTADGRSVVAGRQRLVIGDSRYVGNVGYRQNEQTFDALRLGFETDHGVTLGYAYLDRVHRIFGDDSAGGEWDLSGHLLGIETAIGDGKFSLTGLLVENESVPGLSSQTFAANWSHGFQLAGRPVDYYVEFANQGDYGHATGPDFELNALRVQARIRFDTIAAWAGVEILEGDGTRGFATPLATLHKFQGFADVFLTTPANGIQDVYVGGSASLGDGRWLSGRSLQLIWHDFQAENGNADYGNEIDLVFNARLTERVGMQFKFADFDGASGGPTSRQRIAFALSYSY